jgi:hypothetical protein
MIDWLSENWIQMTIPLLTFFATLIIGFWLRRIIFVVFVFRMATSKWQGVKVILNVLRRPFILWFVLFGAAIALELSQLSKVTKDFSIQIIWSFFITTIVWAIIALLNQFIQLYLPDTKPLQRTITIISNIIRIVIISVGILVIFEIWHISTTPALLVLLLVMVVAFLVFHNVFFDFFASMQLNANPRFRIGDYIKLETGEEGYVEEINWNTTLILGMDDSKISIPNGRLLQHTVINYGRPLKKANEPFIFYSRVDLPELTGVSARNLNELAGYLKQASDDVVYYHTHHYLAEHHYLTPEPANDFAVWVTNTLGDEVLGELLASIDTFSFSSLSLLRDRIVGVIKEYIATSPKQSREVETGRDIHFMQSVSVIIGTPYKAHDLREFIEALRKVSLNSLYYHMFESRLRLGQLHNDFSMWLEESLGEADLARDILQLDPYTYNLEGLRSSLIQLIEKHIK